MLESNEIQRVFEIQRARRRAMRHTTAAERIERLERLRTVLLERQEDIAEGIHQDLGRPTESRAEIDTVMPGFRS